MHHTTHAVDVDAVPTQTFDWGAIKWLVTPGNTEGAGFAFGEVLLLPGQGHARHNHPQSDPGGPEKDLEGLPDFNELPAGATPAWTRA